MPESSADAAKTGLGSAGEPAIASSGPPTSSRWRDGVRATFRVNWAAFDPAAGAALAILLALAAALGQVNAQVGLAALMGALQGFIAVVLQPVGRRIPTALLFTAFGGGVTLIAELAAPSAWSSVAALTVVSFVSALSTVLNPASAQLANALSIWCLLVIATAPAQGNPGAMGAGFLTGALAVALGAWLVSRVSSPVSENAPTRLSWSAIRANLSWWAPPVRHAVIYSLASGLSLTAGFLVFPRHPHWTALTTMLLIAPTRAATVEKGLQRLFGTAIGSAIALTVVARIDSPVLLQAVFLLAAFVMAATLNVGYPVFATALTVMIFVLLTMLGADLASSIEARLAETLLGVTIAVTATFLRHVVGGDPPPGAVVAPAGAATGSVGESVGGPVNLEEHSR